MVDYAIDALRKSVADWIPNRRSRSSFREVLRILIGGVSQGWGCRTLYLSREDWNHSLGCSLRACCRTDTSVDWVDYPRSTAVALRKKHI